MLRDKGDVTRGLLVRQNYTELDVGRPKAEVLADRLHAISDDITASPRGSDVLTLRQDSNLPNCDLIIDATISNAVTAFLDERLQATQQRPLVAQVATDVRTSTLGLITVAAPDWPGTLSQLDESGRRYVWDHAHLERYRVFWDQPAPSDELVPARGCSVPTFHGSAADTAGVAASLVSLLGPHLKADTSGVHLMALPHAGGDGPCHVFVPAGLPAG